MEPARIRDDASAEPQPVRESSPPAGAVAGLLTLQRTAGNRAVTRLLARADAGTPAPAAAPDAGTPADAGTAADAGTPAPVPAANPKLDVQAPSATEFTVTLKNYQDAYVPYTTNCGDAAAATYYKLAPKEVLYVQKGHQPGLRTYDRSKPNVWESGAKDAAQTDLNWNATKVAETAAYIKSAIDRGMPAFAGVNEAGGVDLTINEHITDHFLVIAGYTAARQADGTWAVTKLQAIDNAATDPAHKFPTFNVTASSIVKPAVPGPKHWAYQYEYQLTQVRVSTHDVEAAKKTSAWWN